MLYKYSSSCSGKTVPEDVTDHTNSSLNLLELKIHVCVFSPSTSCYHGHLFFAYQVQVHYTQ